MAVPTAEELGAEVLKTCEKCGFAPDKWAEHFMKHQPAKWSYGKRLQSEAMIFKCYRCKYEWKLSLEKRW